MTTTADELREQVRERYAKSARAVTEGDAEGCGCGDGGCCADAVSEDFGESLYTERAADRAAGRRGARLARLREPDRGRGAATRETPSSTWARAAGST